MPKITLPLLLSSYFSTNQTNPNILELIMTPTQDNLINDEDFYPLHQELLQILMNQCRNITLLPTPAEVKNLPNMLSWCLSRYGSVALKFGENVAEEAYHLAIHCIKNTLNEINLENRENSEMRILLPLFFILICLSLCLFLNRCSCNPLPCNRLFCFLQPRNHPVREEASLIRRLDEDEASDEDSEIELDL